MTANRDRHVWAVAQGRDEKVDDSNTPPFLPVKTNNPGQDPDGTHVFLDPEEEIKLMTVAKGMKVNLFASEKDFPELAKPVQMAFDPQGRLWVTAWPTYPHWKPKEEMNDKLLILEDTKGTGHADKMTVFADHLHCPTGFEFYNGGVIVAQAPACCFSKTRTVATMRHPRPRSRRHRLRRHASHGEQLRARSGRGHVFPRRHLHAHAGRNPLGPTFRNANAGVYRYEPRTQKFEAYVTYRLSPIRMAMFGTVGGKTWSSTAPAPIPITPRCSPAISISRRNITGRRTSINNALVPALASNPVEPAFSRRMQGNLLVAT